MVLPADQIRSVPMHPITSSAKEALARIDAIEEITPYHYIWYKHKDGDQFTTISDIKDEIYNGKYPAQLNSKSATLREIAQQHEKYSSQLPKRWHSFS